METDIVKIAEQLSFTVALIIAVAVLYRDGRREREQYTDSLNAAAKSLTSLAESLSKLVEKVSALASSQELLEAQRDVIDSLRNGASKRSTTTVHVADAPG